MKFGSHLRAKRLESHTTLREFARTKELDAGNLSRIERSKVLPEAPLTLFLLYTYGFKRGGKGWKAAVNAYCRDLVADARSELDRE